MEKESNNQDNISDLEIDVLLIYYIFSDQWGRVNLTAASNFAVKHGIVLDQTPVTLEQRHYDLLMDSNAIPDVRLLLNKIALLPAPKKKRKK